MIPSLAELAGRLGVHAAFLPVVLAIALTGIVFLVPTVFRWFEDRKS